LLQSRSQRKLLLLMPRREATHSEIRLRGGKDATELRINATGLPGGSLRLLLLQVREHGSKCHGLAPWCSRSLLVTPVVPASNVRIHRASRWHYKLPSRCLCSSERNDPPGKPVALQTPVALPIATSVTNHRASWWHYKYRATDFGIGDVKSGASIEASVKLGCHRDLQTRNCLTTSES
jgi:hypothetical protein